MKGGSMNERCHLFPTGGKSRDRTRLPWFHPIAPAGKLPRMSMKWTSIQIPFCQGIRPWVFAITLLGFAAPYDAMIMAQDDQGPGEDLISRQLVFQQLPDIRPAPVEGYESDAAYLRAMAERSNDLARKAGAEREETTQVDLWLAAANHLLAFEIEPACTRRFHHLDPPDTPVSAEVAAALTRAREWLQKANEMLETLRTREEIDAQWLASAARRHRALTAFAQGLSEYLDPSPGGEGTSAAREAASAVAVLLEDDQEGVAAAAALWHAALRARGPDSAAALSVLPVTAADLPKNALPHAFFARLLRCELLSQGGGHGVALALLSKMEEPAARWFGQGSDRDAAMRALAWTKLRILKSWHDELIKSESNGAEAAWCAERMRAIIVDRFPEDRRTVLRVSPVIPVIAAAGGSAHRPTTPVDKE